MAYAMIDRRLEGRTWVAGDAFTFNGRCAAAPALFYAATYLPLPPQQVQLSAWVFEVA